MSGAGAILFLESLHYFSLKFVDGQQTNNHDELYDLWILMKTTMDKGIKQLQVYGD